MSAACCSRTGRDSETAAEEEPPMSNGDLPLDDGTSKTDERLPDPFGGSNTLGTI
jgi:hypothetical protein